MINLSKIVDDTPHNIFKDYYQKAIKNNQKYIESISRFINDKDESKSVNSLEDVVSYSDFIFLSVPTPSNEDGSVNLNYVEDALQEISFLTSDIEQGAFSLDNIIFTINLLS